jgi:hypothetical protein
MNSGLRASGGFSQPGANSSNYQRSMQHIRGGSPGTTARKPESQPNAANRNANLNNANRNGNLEDNPAARRDLANNRNPAENAARNEPFSRDWYDAHPDAWRYDHPDADAFAYAGAPNMYSWWGAGAGRGVGVPTAVPVPVPVGGGGGVGVPAAPVNSAPVASNPTTAAQADPADAGSDSQPGATPPGDWLPLGVFSLSHPDSAEEVTRAIQLATDKSGVIKGNQIDLLSDATTEVHGRYEAETKTLHWTVGKSDGVVFTAKADDFGKEGKPIPVVSHYASGSSSRWIMTPIPNSPDAEGGTDSDSKPGE